MDPMRWRQRLESYGKALDRLRAPLSAQGPEAFSELERMGLIQGFEFTFELAWKTLKDYLEYNGVALPLATPRQVIKQAFAVGLLADGQLWIDMLEARNQASHLYDQEMSDRILAQLADRHLPALIALRDHLSRLADEP